MKTTIKLWYEEKYLPNKRCRKLRERAVSKDVDIEVCEVTKEEFPVAFVIHDYESVYEGAKSYSDFEGNGDYRMFSEEIRGNCTSLSVLRTAQQSAQTLSHWIL